MIRLQKILSTAGIASRRAAETLITQGRVTVNGRTVTELGTRADPGQDDIRVDGRRVKAAARRLYFLLFKPRGYVTTRSDPEKRPTVIEILARAGIRDYVYPVGRLDYDSEGLLLLTSDGDLAARLTHPSHEVEREYQARVRGVPDARALDRLQRGIVIDGRRTAPAKVTIAKTIESPGRSDAMLTVIVREGRNRQVRRMCEIVGHPVVRLRRVRIGPLTIDGLNTGDFRELSEREVAALKKAAGTGTATRPATGSRTRSAAKSRSRSRRDRPPRG